MLRIVPAAYISIEMYDDAVRVTKDKWPDVHQCRNVTNITMQEVCEMMDVVPGTQVWFPCQPHSFHNLERRKLSTTRTLHGEINRIADLVEKCGRKVTVLSSRSAGVWMTRRAKLSPRS